MAYRHPRPWRRDSDYAPAPRVPLSREQRTDWYRRVKAEIRAGHLPGKAFQVAEALLACMGPDGLLYPSQETLAGKGRVGVRTVARHVNRMVALGLVEKHRRLVRRPWPGGGRGATRVEQTSNAYVLTFPSRPVSSAALRAPLAMVRPNTGGHFDAGDLDLRYSVERQLEALASLERTGEGRDAVLRAAWWRQPRRPSDEARVW